MWVKGKKESQNTRLQSERTVGVRGNGNIVPQRSVNATARCKVAGSTGCELQRTPKSLLMMESRSIVSLSSEASLGVLLLPAPLREKREEGTSEDRDTGRKRGADPEAGTARRVGDLPLRRLHGGNEWAAEMRRACAGGCGWCAHCARVLVRRTGGRVKIE